MKYGEVLEELSRGIIGRREIWGKEKYVFFHTVTIVYQVIDLLLMSDNGKISQWAASLEDQFADDWIETRRF